ncbi:MAG: 50S ribosomal protein L4 [Polyangiales bacterium]|jgi:large subunit ribosomal protein L4
MKFDVFNLKREKTGEIDLADAVFGSEVKEALFYDVVKAQLASRRAGTQKAKTRTEVSGSSKKLYKQKGTGRSRHGSIRAPVYVGGGRAHPPLPRDWSYRPPRQMRVGALKSALSLLAKEGRLVIVDAMKLDEIRTKGLLTALSALKVSESALLVDGKDNETLRLSARNLPNHTVLPPEGVNVYDILRHDHLVLSQDAAKALEARCLR